MENKYTSVKLEALKSIYEYEKGVVEKIVEETEYEDLKDFIKKTWEDISKLTEYQIKFLSDKEKLEGDYYTSLDKYMIDLDELNIINGFVRVISKLKNDLFPLITKDESYINKLKEITANISEEEKNRFITLEEYNEEATKLISSQFSEYENLIGAALENVNVIEANIGETLEDESAKENFNKAITTYEDQLNNIFNVISREKQNYVKILKSEVEYVGLFNKYSPSAIGHPYEIDRVRLNQLYEDLYNHIAPSVGRNLENALRALCGSLGVDMEQLMEYARTLTPTEDNVEETEETIEGVEKVN